jgi:hypothetical protein
MQMKHKAMENISYYVPTCICKIYIPDSTAQEFRQTYAILKKHRT